MRSDFLKKVSIVNLIVFGLILSASAQQQKPTISEGPFKPTEIFETISVPGVVP